MHTWIVRISLRVGWFGVFGILSALLVERAGAQGLIVDRRPEIPLARSFEVTRVTIDARVEGQVATTRVSQTFRNPGSTTIESEYLFPLPDAGGIQDFVLMVDGKELPGRLLPRDEARSIYEAIVRRKKDPALLEYAGRGLIRTSVFPIPPGSERTVTLRYTQLCRRDGNRIEYSYPFGTQKFTAKPIQRLELRLGLSSPDADIKTIYCPGYDAEIKRPDDRRADVRVTLNNVIPSEDFQILYSLDDRDIGATVLSYRPDGDEDGYFLLLASPKVERDQTPMPKTVIFVLDRSGSMQGCKIEQAREALTFVVNNLRDDDTFNIIAYDDRVESFRPELQRFTPESRKDALTFVDNIRAGGSTNIDEALTTALGMIEDDSRPSYVLFLTDGLPTAGQTDEQTIAKHARSSNTKDARLFAFGVGFDVNARLLDRLSTNNRGTSVYVTPTQDIEAEVARFYGRLASPVLADLRIRLGEVPLNRTSPRDLPDLFDGEQLVWVGRYTKSGETTLTIEGRVGDDAQTYQMPVTLAEANGSIDRHRIATLWAIRRIGDLIDRIDLEGENPELIDELVTLSTRYGILTPYTAYLADETNDFLALSRNRDRTRLFLGGLQQVQGQFGVDLRMSKRSLQAGQVSGGLIPTPSRPGQPLADSSAAGGYGSFSRAPQSGQSSERLQGQGPPAGGDGGFFGRSVSEAGRRAGKARDRAEDRPDSIRENEDVSDDRDSNTNPHPTIKRVAGRTFYWRNGEWVDARIDADTLKTAVRIVQFGDDYFELARTLDAAESPLLAFNEPVVLKIAAKVYRIVPESAASK